MTGPKDESDEDPTYRIACDVERCKVGCVLIQAALGESQLPLLVARTNFDRLEAPT